MNKNKSDSEAVAAPVSILAHFHLLLGLDP